MTVRGDLADATLNLAQGIDPLNPRLLALASLSVAGWIRDTLITTAGHVGSIIAGGMERSDIFAGLSLAALPDDTGDFLSQCRIKSFTVKGIKQDGAYVESFIDSNVAAWQILKASVREVRTDNTPDGGTTFGIVAFDIGLLTWQQAPSRFRWPERRPGDWPDAVFTDDFLVGEVSA